MEYCTARCLYRYIYIERERKRYTERDREIDIYREKDGVGLW